MPRSLRACAAIALVLLSACSGSGSAPIAPQLIPQSAGGERSAQAIPAAQTNVVVNGGFETGSLSGWTSVGSGSGLPKVTSAAHSGSYAAFMGTTKSPEIDGLVGLEQSVTIPSGATLSLYVRGVSDDTVKYADEEADLLNASGTVVYTCFKTLFDTTTWTAESCDLSAYAGQTLTLFIGISGNGYSSTYLDAWYDDVAITGTAASPGPSASPSASPSPSAAPTASPTPKPSASPTAAPTATATPSPAPTPSAAPSGSHTVDPGPFTIVGESSFESIVKTGHSVRFSTYVLSPSSSLEAALVSAAQNGGSVTVDLPSDSYVKTLGNVYQEDQQSAQNIQNAGGTVLWDAGDQSPPMPLHAKLAIVDGTAYLDGRNWDSSDVIVSETGSADLTAIGNALALTPSDSPYLDTIKQDALGVETSFITSAKGTTIDYMTESFGAGNVANALIARAQAGAAVHVIVLNSDVSSSEKTTLTQLQQAGADVELNPGSGSEKMAIIGNAAWFGSSNSTAGAATQIDWGAVFTQSSVLSTLQSNFNSVLATCTKYSG